ncbi:MAG TPA: single-stranded DNA-binding protein [Acidimicrobiales bacterium]|jgi:single-strand DNA-binding protein|nr:single-stranded DNA-binding protein [Acidimicrobiales bacterium]
MAFDNNVVLVGNVTRDPELRFTQGGAAVCGFGIAWNQRSNQGEDKAHYFDVSCWRDLAENVAESVTKGMRVVVYGRLDYRNWEGQNGEKRSAVQIVADEVSPSIRWATAQVRRNERGESAAPRSNQSNPSNAGSDFGAGYEIPDEEPF